MKKLLFAIGLFIGLGAFFSCSNDSDDILDIPGADVPNDSLCGDTIKLDSMMVDGTSCGKIFHYEDTLKYVKPGEELIIKINNIEDDHCSNNHRIYPNDSYAPYFFTNKFIWGIGEETEGGRNYGQIYNPMETGAFSYNVDYKFHWLTYTQLNDTTLQFKIDESYNGDIEWIYFREIFFTCSGSIRFVLKK